MQNNGSEGNSSFPTVDLLEGELAREKRKQKNNKVLLNTIYALIIVAAAAVLVVTLFITVLRIYGNSMTPTVNEGEIVVAIKGSEFEQKDVVALWYGNKVLVKRVIAGPGEWVNIDEEGNVYVNGEYLDEPYLKEKAMGDCTITFPYQVPEGRYFVLGDHRSISADSRNVDVGCIETDQIIGRLIFRIWPFEAFGVIE